MPALALTNRDTSLFFFRISTAIVWSFWPFLQEWPEPDEETVHTSETSCSSSLIGAGEVVPYELSVRHVAIFWI
jgi:hypothetical protein